MEALYAIGFLVVVVAVIVVSVNLYTRRNPNATVGDTGSLVALILVIVLMGCFIAIGVQDDAARKCQQQPSASCTAASR
jgi:UDP-N-acetylmuramyl pentapeptide phosphotransferase/UDP-N-acetylglucosamine-1-phosphate transferase